MCSIARKRIVVSPVGRIPASRGSVWLERVCFAPEKKFLGFNVDFLNTQALFPKRRHRFFHALQPFLIRVFKNIRIGANFLEPKKCGLVLIPKQVDLNVRFHDVIFFVVSVVKVNGYPSIPPSACIGQYPDGSLVKTNGENAAQSSGLSPAGAIFTMRGSKRASISTKSDCADITAWMSL